MLLQSSSTGNLLLQALPEESLDRLLPLLEPVDLPLRKVLHEPGEPITHAYFVEAGVVSLIILLEGGQEVEVGLIGRDGLVGFTAAMGAGTATTEAMVQVSGRALRLPVDMLQGEMARDPALTSMLQRFTLALHLQVAQTAACNGRHSLDERLARWLLMVHDRVESDELPTTHEVIAKMLGVRRAGVTVALGILERMGAIRTSRGAVTVLDRAGLEAAACECYWAVRRAVEPPF